jgi:hypothetical protein
MPEDPMSDPHLPFAERMARAHAALRENLRDVQDAVVETTGAANPAALRARLEAVRIHLVEHFRLEERGGYMAEVVEPRPHLAREAEELHDQHRHLLQSLDELIREAGGPAPELADKVAAWLAELQGHESRENRLIQTAFNQDIAAED